MSIIKVQDKDWDFDNYEAAAISVSSGEIRCGTMKAVKRTAHSMIKTGMVDTVVYVREASS